MDFARLFFCLYPETLGFFWNKKAKYVCMECRKCGAEEEREEKTKKETRARNIKERKDACNGPYPAGEDRICPREVGQQPRRNMKIRAIMPPR
jgi:hypothetical protein